MRDLGNTLIVVEHDDDTMRAADYLVDIGPGAGEHGGQIVSSGTPQKVMKDKKSLTGQYLSGKNELKFQNTVDLLQTVKFRFEVQEAIILKVWMWTFHYQS